MLNVSVFEKIIQLEMFIIIKLFKIGQYWKYFTKKKLK
jgi:hypothetical protein